MTGKEEWRRQEDAEGDEGAVGLLNATYALTRISDSMSGLMQASGAAAMRAACQSLAERVAE